MGQGEMLEQIRRMGVNDERVMGAMAAVDRAEFAVMKTDQAYEDRPLPIGFGQTISQPYTVAKMLELLIHDLGFRIHESRVLEIGAGSGYQTAILAKLFGRVYSIEVIPELSWEAKRVLDELRISNYELRVGNGKGGWKERSPFEAIIAAANAQEVPPAWVEQLVVGGRIVLPVKGEMMVGDKEPDGTMRWTSAGRFSFVPLV